jgi:flagellar protein FliL
VKKLIMAAIGLVLIGGGGGGAWWWMHRAEAAAPNEAEAKQAHHETEPGDTGVLGLEPFLVNLADADAPRFLRVTLRLVIAGKAAATELSEDEMSRVRLRSAILELLTEQTSNVLVTPEGKTALKKAIVERCAKAVTEVKVVDVLFSEFVVQF